MDFFESIDKEIMDGTKHEEQPSTFEKENAQNKHEVVEEKQIEEEIIIEAPNVRQSSMDNSILNYPNIRSGMLSEYALHFYIKYFTVGTVEEIDRFKASLKEKINEYGPVQEIYVTGVKEDGVAFGVCMKYDKDATFIADNVKLRELITFYHKKGLPPVMELSKAFNLFLRGKQVDRPLDSTVKKRIEIDLVSDSDYKRKSSRSRSKDKKMNYYSNRVPDNNNIKDTRREDEKKKTSYC
jgi:hypothetical protein